MLIAIDPGTSETAWLAFDSHARKVVGWAKEPNARVLERLRTNEFPLHVYELAIEMIASYGMPVGAEVFEAVLWIGRFHEAMAARTGAQPRLVFRREVKLHVCGDSRAKDPNIRTALLDLFGGKEKAIGKKAAPGPLHGLSGDGWAALAVAVTVAGITPAPAGAA